MALLERLKGDDGYIKIPVHQFWASLKELHLNETSKIQIQEYFNMDESDISDFNWLIGKYEASTDRTDFVELMHSIFMLAEVDTPGYNTNTDLAARINRID